MSPAEIAAAPWWRWESRLWAVTKHGNRVTLAHHSSVEADEILRGMGAVPDLADPLLPGWLLHLLRERRGAATQVTQNGYGLYVVWCGARALACADTELDALVSALRGSP